MPSLDLVEEIITKPYRLSEDQQKAVLSESKYNRIIAGAGAGKTETITRRIAYLLLVGKVEPASIVAFTFTEKAAQSMKSRIYQRVEEIAGSSATTHIGEMYVGTIHAYAKRVLDDYFGYGNYSVLDENQEIAYLMRHGWSLGLQEYGSFYADGCRVFLRTCNMVWSELLDEDKLEKRAHHFYERLKRYESKLEKDKQLTFGRMIQQAVLRIRESPNVLSHVHHLIVDEYQDINRAQQELIKLIGKNASIFIVGDPKQSIYQWRGSDQRFFDIFTKTFSKTKSFSIRENRRSTQKIVQNANRFAQSFETLNVESMDPTRTEKGFIGLAGLKKPEDEAKWIAGHIEELVLVKKQISFSDVGILTRSVSTSGRPLIEEFKRRRIPYIVGGKVGLFQRDEAQALGRIFTWFWDDGFWVENPWNWGEQVRGDQLLSSGLHNWSNAQTHGLPEDAEHKLREIKEDLHSGESKYKNFTELYQDVLTVLGFGNLDYDDDNDAAVMANLGRFNGILTDYESANRIGGRSIHWKKDLKGLCWFMNSYGLQAYEEQSPQDIRGLNAVQIMTVHQAKGLEWPLVFIFSLVNRRFPSSMVGRQEDWCGVPRDLFEADRYEGTLEDERRLFYVAITRARDALILSYFRGITRRVGKSSFLEDIDGRQVVDLKAGHLPELAIHPRQFYDELQTFSAGEIITYNICPYMYLLRELWGYQPGLVQALGYGNALHYCLRMAGEFVKNERYSPRSAILTAVDGGFHMPFVGGVVFEKFKNAARKTLIDFSMKYGDDLERIEEVEYRLEYPVQNATIIGKVDVILRDGGSMEVRDYKTSEDARTFEETATQVKLYTLGLGSVERPITSGSVAYLQEPTVKMVDVRDDLLVKTRKFAEKTIEEILHRQFKSNPGKNCNRCDFRSICRWSVE